MKTIMDLAETMKEAVESVGRHFNSPDDDWVPIVSLVPQEGDNVMLALDGQWFKDSETKDLLVEKIMVPAVNGVGAKMLATIFSAWTLEVEDIDPDNLPKPSESDDRKEMVVMTVMDSFSISCYTATIIRHQSAPPELEDWQELEQGVFTGRFVETIQEALRDSSGQTDPEFMEVLHEQTIQIDE